MIKCCNQKPKTQGTGTVYDNISNSKSDELEVTESNMPKKAYCGPTTSDVIGFNIFIYKLDNVYVLMLSKYLVYHKFL